MTKNKTTPHVPPPSREQQQFQQGTRNLLDEARSVVENAVGQGQELNPMIYQMLGLQPQYEDHSADLQNAQSEMDAAEKQYNEAQQTLATLRGIPTRQRTRDQRKQLRQLTKQLPQLATAFEKTKDVFGRLQTLPKPITGFTRLDPAQIPATSPFSTQNPLHQAQAAEAQRLNDYLSGRAAVDPTLVHQYDQAESALRAKLEQRYGPDFENTSVGQMALQNFARQKNEAFATWNQQQVEKYNNLAFQGQANLQNLLAGQIGLLREPEQNQLNEGAQLSNLSAARLAQQQTINQWLLGHAGLSTNVSSFGIQPGKGGEGGGLGGALSTLFGPTIDPATGKATGPSYASQATNWALDKGSQAMNWAVGKGSQLYDWATGAGAGAAAGAGAGAAAGAGAGVAADAGASLAGEYAAETSAAALLGL